MSYMEVVELDEDGQSWVEVEGAGWRWVDGLAISNLELNFDHISEKARNHGDFKAKQNSWYLNNKTNIEILKIDILKSFFLTKT